MIILHGENQVQSRARLQQIKEKERQKELVNLNGKTLELSVLIQALEAGSLFGGDRLVVVENILSSPASKRLTEILEYLIGQQARDLVIWEEKAVSAAALKKIGGEAEEFKISSTVFSFIESISPSNTKMILKGFDQALEHDAVELLFFMLVRQIRQLIQVVSDQASFRGPSWLVGKLARQGRAFGLKRLLSMHQQLYEIDKGIKMGKTNLDLKTELELWMIGL